MADRLHLEWDGNPEVVPVLEWDLAELSDGSPGDEGFCEPCWDSLVEGLPSGWLENVDGVEVIVNERGESPDSGGSGGSGAELGDALGVFEMDPEEGNGAEEENEEENENEEDFSSVLSELADVVFEDEPVLPSPFVLDCPEVPGVNCRSCDYHRIQTKDPNMKCSLCYMRMHAFAVYGECFCSFWVLVTCMKKRCFVLFFHFCVILSCRTCFSLTSQGGVPWTWRAARAKEEVLP